MLSKIIQKIDDKYHTDSVRFNFDLLKERYYIVIFNKISNNHIDASYVLLLINYKTAKNILNDINISKEDFFKKHFYLVLRENIEYYTFIYLNGKFNIVSKKDNMESMIIQYSADCTNHEFEKGIFNEKNKLFEKSSVTGIVLDSRHKDININEIITPDNYKEILNIND